MCVGLNLGQQSVLLGVMVVPGCIASLHDVPVTVEVMRLLRELLS